MPSDLVENIRVVVFLILVLFVIANLKEIILFVLKPFEGILPFLPLTLVVVTCGLIGWALGGFLGVIIAIMILAILVASQLF